MTGMIALPILCATFVELGWPLKAPVDLSDFDAVEIEYRNTGPLKRPLRAAVKTARGDAGPVGMHWLGAGETGVMRVALKTHPWRLDRPLPLKGMQACPQAHEGLDRVTAIDLFHWPTVKGDGFEVKSLRAVADRGSVALRAATFLPFVDEYGQFIHADWPGKVGCDGDLKTACERENAELDAAPRRPFADADRFGGFASGPQLEATGHFRTAKIKGRWWLVDPDGHVFFSHGICCVRSAEECPTKGRERYFRGDFPERGDFATSNLKRKHGTSWKDRFAVMAHRRLASWGFNTLAMWSDETLGHDRKTPYVVATGTRGPDIPGTGGDWGAIHDPFSREFKDHLERYFAAERRNGRAEDPWLIGYFVDNELPWDALSGDPDRERRYAEEYYRVVSETIRRHAPKKLYLGSRIALGGDGVKRASARYCDVVSFNVYQTHPECDLPVGSDDKPVLIGEFHFGALGRGLFNTGCVEAENRADAARRYEMYMDAALAHPRCVGAHWFQWRDEPLAGRFDGENYGIGFVSVTDDPYPELVAASRRVATRLYRNALIGQRENGETK